MKKLKIAIFTDSFIPLCDGIVVSTINLAKGLADRGHKIYIIAPKYRNIKEFRYKNVKVKRVSGIPAFFYRGFKFTSPLTIGILKYLKKEKIDIIHFQTPIGLGIQALLMALFLKKPVVGTFHTFFTDTKYLKHLGVPPRFIQKFSWLYARAFYNKCDLVTCPSESAKKELLKNGFIKPIKVISNGIDFSVFDNLKYREVKKQLNPNGKILLFVGRIAHEKNINFLIDCFKLIANKDKSVKLVITGSGPQMEEIRHKIHRLSLPDRVILTGSIEHKNLVKSGIYKASDLFITASTTESQGITMLEAQANGLVCVGLNAKGVKDLIRNNYNGFLVRASEREFANKVLELLRNKNLYNRMKRNTLREVRKHGINKIVKIWEKVYLSMIN